MRGKRVRLSLLTYEYVDGIAERRAPYFDEHLALIARYCDEQRLAIAGAVGEPPRSGLLGFHHSADAASFVAEDPYVSAGLVVRWGSNRGWS